MRLNQALRRAAMVWVPVLLAATTVAAQKTAASNYAHDVAPILNSQCVACHHQEGPAPFGLTTYQQAKSHAHQIADVTRTHYMPPWLPDTHLSHFVDQLELSDAQIKTLAAWAAAGAPAGDLATAPPSPSFPDGWQLGKPDLVLTSPEAWTMPASSVDVYRNFIFRVPIREAKYVRAVEIRPGNTRIVHHANVLLDTKEVSRKRDGEDGQPGFGGMDIALESDAFDPDSHFIYWKPGAVVWSEPQGMSWQLDPGTDLILNMHMQASGKPEKVQPSIGLYFTNDPPTLHPMLLELDADEQLDIPAGATNFAVHDDFTLPVDLDVVAIYPHAHYLGKELDTYATLPDGTRQWLEKIPQWDQNWQGIYRFEKYVHLPRGTVISMRFTYDNSAQNPRNPSQPPRRVKAGNSSTDEMAHVWLQVLPTPPVVNGEDARLLLQRAVMLHTLQKRPSDFAAHFNLGALALGQNDPVTAEKEFRAALAVIPKDAAALNSLGASLRQQGLDADALTAFRQACASDPTYADAHFNLAMALGSAGNFAEAAAEFRRVLELTPNDAGAEANLGAAYAQLGQWADAEQHLRRALALDPQNKDAQDNLSVVVEHTSQH
jgi:Flp pilus assembly protein TadD/cytochrome c553